MTIQDTATLTSGTIFMGENNTPQVVGMTATINQTGGTVTATGDIRIAHWGNETSTWNISAGTLNSNANMFVSWDGNGILNASGTADVNANNVTISRGQALTVSDDATFDATTIYVGGNSRGQGKLNIQDNAVVATVNLSVGDVDGPGEDGTVNQDGGSFTVTSHVRIGHYNGEASNYNMNGGTLALTGTPAGGTEQAGILYLGIDGTGNFTQTGGDVTAAGMRLDNRGDTGGTDTFTLNGGTMTLGARHRRQPQHPDQPRGGTLRASADGRAGGDDFDRYRQVQAIIDTNGFNDRISGTLSGTGGLNKDGDGTLTLTAENTYTGGTVIDDGVLDLNEAAGAGNGVGAIRGTVDVNADGTLRLSTANALGWQGGGQSRYPQHQRRPRR